MAHLVLMCTANQCRSPMAAVLAQAVLTDPSWRIESCGELVGGQPASGGAIRAVADRGLDLRSHRSTQLAASHLAADLVLTMERRHLFAIAELDLGAVSRAFPLREFVELALPRGPGESFAEWVVATAARRNPSQVLTSSRRHDVDDPMGRNRAAYRRCVDELDALIDRFSTLVGSGPVT